MTTWIDDYRKRFPHLYPTVAEERRLEELRDKYRLQIDRYFGWKAVEDFKRRRGMGGTATALRGGAG